MTFTKSIGQELERRILDFEKECIQTRGRFRIALSGGSLIGHLANSSLIRSNTDLSKWQVYFVDERWCSLDSEDSICGEYQRNMPEFIKAVQVHVPYQEGLTVDEGAIHYEQVLSEANGNDDIDMIVLGMGPDGHTASIFPPIDKNALMSNRRVLPVHDSPKPPSERITMTIPFMLSKATKVLFVVSGEGKGESLWKILKENDPKFPPTYFPDAEWLLDYNVALAAGLTN